MAGPRASVTEPRPRRRTAPRSATRALAPVALALMATACATGPRAPVATPASSETDARSTTVVPSADGATVGESAAERDRDRALGAIHETLWVSIERDSVRVKAAIRFEWRGDPRGADPWLDLPAAATIESARLDGELLPAPPAGATRLTIPRDRLAPGPRALEVELALPWRPRTGEQGEVLGSLGGPAGDEARAFPCFDQGTIKTSFEAIVEAPRGWSVAGLSAAERKSAPAEARGREIWTLASTPRILCREQRLWIGEWRILENSEAAPPVAWLLPARARASRAAVIGRAAQDLSRRLAQLGERVRLPFPWTRALLVDAPDAGAGVGAGTGPARWASLGGGAFAMLAGGATPPRIGAPETSIGLAPAWLGSWASPVEPPDHAVLGGLGRWLDSGEPSGPAWAALERLLGPEDFREGIARFLTAAGQANGRAADLFARWQESSGLGLRGWWTAVTGSPPPRKPLAARAAWECDVAGRVSRAELALDSLGVSPIRLRWIGIGERSPGAAAEPPAGAPPRRVRRARPSGDPGLADLLVFAPRARGGVIRVPAVIGSRCPRAVLLDPLDAPGLAPLWVGDAPDVAPVAVALAALPVEDQLIAAWALSAAGDASSRPWIAANLRRLRRASPAGWRRATEARAPAAEALATIDP